MQKNQAYHEAAIQYNEGLAVAAEELAPTLPHEEVKKWCVAVGKQHRFHAKRHKSALDKLLLKEESAPVEALADGLDVPEPMENLESPIEQEHTAVAEPDLEALPDGPKGLRQFDDGCEGSHQPTKESCEFYPKAMKGDQNG